MKTLTRPKKQMKTILLYLGLKDLGRSLVVNIKIYCNNIEKKYSFCYYAI